MNDHILYDISYADVKLIPFSKKENDSNLKYQYLSWLNNPKVVKLIGSSSLLNTNKDISFVEKSFKRFTQSSCKGFFIKYEPNQIYIGTAKLDQISTYTRSAMDGIMIGELNYWGLGLSKKVYTILLKYAFLELNLHKVYGGCNEKNVAMIKTFLNLGYKQEARMRESDFIDGKFSDHLYFGILQKEFLSKINK